MPMTLVSCNIRFICQVFASRPIMVTFVLGTSQVQVQGIVIYRDSVTSYIHCSLQM